MHELQLNSKGDWVLVKPGIRNEKWKQEMGNGDIWKGIDCTHHSLQAKLKKDHDAIDDDAKPTCTELRAAMLRNHNKIKLGNWTD